MGIDTGQYIPSLETLFLQNHHNILDLTFNLQKTQQRLKWRSTSTLVNILDARQQLDNDLTVHIF